MISFSFHSHFSIFLIFLIIQLVLRLLFKGWIGKSWDFLAGFLRQFCGGLWWDLKRRKKFVLYYAKINYFPLESIVA
jgi:hypothetical protein